MLVLFLTYAKSSEAETAFYDTYDVCKTSLNQSKHSSINRVPSNIDFFTIDLKETSCKIYSEQD